MRVPEPYVEHTLGYVEAVEGRLSEIDHEDDVVNGEWYFGIWVLPNGLVPKKRGAS
jgi:hypothetical protein